MEPEQLFFTSKEEARTYIHKLYDSLVRIRIENKNYSIDEGIERLINDSSSYSGKTKKLFFYLYNFKIRKKHFWRRYFSFIKSVKSNLENVIVKEIIKSINEEVMHYALEDASLYKEHHNAIEILSEIFPDDFFLENFKLIKFPKKKLSRLLEE